MRIPRALEWRAGVALLASAITVLLVAIGLVLVRVDAGIDVQGSFSRTEKGFWFSTTISGQQVRMVQDSEYLRIHSGDRVWYLTVLDIAGDLEHGAVSARIMLDDEDDNYRAMDLAQPVKAKLILNRDVSVLSVLFNGAFKVKSV